MCTVTFIPKGNSQFVLTSNRDEAPNRETIPPDFYGIDDTKMLFPKDKRAGGTWIGLSDKHRLICLLNGGFMMHERQAKYRMSRGVVVKDMMASNDILALIANYDLKDIEPFTLIVVEWQKELSLYELVWDGMEKHVTELPIESKLWSSSSLYNTQMKTERQDWFDEFLDRNDSSVASILDFHKTAGSDNMDYGVIMDRGFVRTTSTTQIEKSKEAVSMRYYDLKTDQVSKDNFQILETINE